MSVLSDLIAGAAWSEWPRTRIRVSGRDAQSLLHNMCTNHILQLEVGQGCEAFFCNAKGKIIGFGNVLRREDCLVIETAADQYETLVAQLDRYVISEDVSFSDLAAEESQWLIVGRRALEILQVSEVRNLTQTIFQAGDVAVRLIPIPFRENSAALLQVASADAASCREHLEQLGFENLAAEQVERIRIASGYPVYGQDITVDHLPQEIDRGEQAISFHKGCYIGQETVARIDAMGHVNRTLTGVTATTGSPLQGLELSKEGNVVGTVTSSVDLAGTQIGLAMIRREAQHAGQILQSAVGDVTVVPLPMTD